jgi:hypothetical protein
VSQELVPLDQLQQMANVFAKSGMFGAKTPEQCMALLLLASAEGIHPAIAMRDFDLIQGRPAKKAEAMLRSFIAAGGSVVWNKLDDTVADATFSHPQGGSVNIIWDMERVKKAKIANEAMYAKYPRAMLRSRCVSEGCRTVYPASTSGLYEPGEIMGFAKEKNMGAAEVVADRSELEALCKEAAFSVKFYLNRAGVKTVADLSDEDYAAAVENAKGRAAKAKGIAEEIKEGAA